MRVERFSLFFGPMLFKRRRGETEYGIGPIPLGGYVKITGMNPHEELPDEVRPRAYYNQPVWKRIVVIGAGPAVNLVLAFMIVWVLYVANGYYVTDTSGSPPSRRARPAATALRPGDQLVSVDGVSGSSDRLRAPAHHAPLRRGPDERLPRRHAGPGARSERGGPDAHLRAASALQRRRTSGRCSGSRSTSATSRSVPAEGRLARHQPTCGR